MHGLTQWQSLAAAAVCCYALHLAIKSIPLKAVTGVLAAILIYQAIDAARSSMILIYIVAGILGLRISVRIAVSLHARHKRQSSAEPRTRKPAKAPALTHGDGGHPIIYPQGRS